MAPGLLTPKSLISSSIGGQQVGKPVLLMSSITIRTDMWAAAALHIPRIDRSDLANRKRHTHIAPPSAVGDIGEHHRGWLAQRQDPYTNDDR